MSKRLNKTGWTLFILGPTFLILCFLTFRCGFNGGGIHALPPNCSYGEGEFVTVNLTPDVSIEEALSLCMTVLELEDGRRNGIPVTRARLDTVWANHKGMARAYIEHVTESVE